MLDRATISYSNAGFIYMVINSGNCISPLKEMDLFIIMDLILISRGISNNLIACLCPSNSNELYLVIIPIAYIVWDTFIEF